MAAGPHHIDPTAYLEELLTQASPDLMRQMLGDFINQILSAQADTVCGADYGTTSDNRVNQRNGYRHRLLDTRVGTVDVAIPKLRHGSFFPDWLLERRTRTERALTTVIATWDLTPFWWTPDIQPGWVGKKGNLPPCLGTPNSSNVMLWPSMKTMRTFHFTRLQQSLESIVPRFSPGFSNTAPANVPARRPCATTPRRRLIPSESASSKKKSRSCAKNAISCARPRNILLKETRW